MDRDKYLEIKKLSSFMHFGVYEDPVAVVCQLNAINEQRRIEKENLYKKQVEEQKQKIVQNLAKRNFELVDPESINQINRWEYSILIKCKDCETEYQRSSDSILNLTIRSCPNCRKQKNKKDAESGILKPCINFSNSLNVSFLKDLEEPYYNWEIRDFLRDSFVDSVDFLLNEPNYNIKEITAREYALLCWRKNKKKLNLF